MAIVGVNKQIAVVRDETPGGRPVVYSTEYNADDASVALGRCLREYSRERYNPRLVHDPPFPLR